MISLHQYQPRTQKKIITANLMTTTGCNDECKELYKELKLCRLEDDVCEEEFSKWLTCINTCKKIADWTFPNKP